MIGDFKKSKDKVFSSYLKKKKLTEKDPRVVAQMRLYLKVDIVTQNSLC